MTKSTFINKIVLSLARAASDFDANAYWEDMDMQKRIGHIASIFGKCVANEIKKHDLPEESAELVYMIFFDEYYFDWKLLCDKTDEEFEEEIEDNIENCVLFRIEAMNIDYNL